MALRIKISAGHGGRRQVQIGESPQGWLEPTRNGRRLRTARDVRRLEAGLAALDRIGRPAPARVDVKAKAAEAAERAINAARLKSPVLKVPGFRIERKPVMNKPTPAKLPMSAFLPMLEIPLEADTETAGLLRSNGMTPAVIISIAAN